MSATIKDYASELTLDIFEADDIAVLLKTSGLARKVYAACAEWPEGEDQYAGLYRLHEVLVGGCYEVSDWVDRLEETCAREIPYWPDV